MLAIVRAIVFAIMWATQVIGIYTILPLPVLYRMYCNTGWSGGNTILRNGVGDEEGGWGAQTRGVFANNSIDSCTMASN